MLFIYKVFNTLTFAFNSLYLYKKKKLSFVRLVYLSSNISLKIQISKVNIYLLYFWGVDIHSINSATCNLICGHISSVVLP